MRKLFRVLKEKFMDLLNTTKVRQISMFTESNDYQY
jgi:hypothetical protein